MPGSTRAPRARQGHRVVFVSPPRGRHERRLPLCAREACLPRYFYGLTIPAVTSFFTKRSTKSLCSGRLAALWSTGALCSTALRREHVKHGQRYFRGNRPPLLSFPASFLSCPGFPSTRSHGCREISVAEPPCRAYKRRPASSRWARTRKPRLSTSMKWSPAGASSTLGAVELAKHSRPRLDPPRRHARRSLDTTRVAPSTRPRYKSRARWSRIRRKPASRPPPHSLPAGDVLLPPATALPQLSSRTQSTAAALASSFRALAVVAAACADAAVAAHGGAGPAPPPAPLFSLSLLPLQIRAQGTVGHCSPSHLLLSLRLTLPVSPSLLFPPSPLSFFLLLTEQRRRRTADDGTQC
jgi:hypothetical protein